MVTLGPVDASAFVQVDRTAFTRFGKPYLVAGANYWQGINLGASDCSGGNRARLKQEVAQMAAMGINNLRVMAASEGPDDQPYRMRPSLMPLPGKYNEAIFVGLDYLLDCAARHNMTVIMTLSNFWHWSGGFSQYVAWVDGNQSIPYPNDPHPPGAFDKYAARFYNDSKVRDQANQLYKNHITEVQSRRNTLNGRVYREDPTIMAWQIANEPQSAPAWWYEDVADFIKKGAPRQLVSSGIESKLDRTDFLHAHQSRSIDYTTCHCWVENWGYYNASDPTALAGAQKYAHDFIKSRAEWAESLHKPIVLEEFGMARDAWRQPMNDGYKYNPDTPTEHKDKYYDGIYQQIVSLVVDRKFSGSNFWAYGGCGRPKDQPNPYGMVWLGDPPHERRGWYSVYDKDNSTVQVIKSYCRNLKELMKE
ncbi:hypothetical protein DFQ28_003542 [Apophysomyces sp. BC1034]|nr:hypothetical protein DFQ30_007148 [Apophysomyces sp. BC1015]KAG0179070.1 hypothetical protein DFQ29_002649 [Apophysomyces sp. BC1021]KAG0189341.1 hypothetical protein DFQ28_003542 [Apophysomyces sp. BC1034]